MGFYNKQFLDELRKIPLGFCPLCGRPVWADDGIFINGCSYHNDCLDE